jgi:hypothetical protein
VIAPVHEVIAGLAGPTRNGVVAEAIADELVRRTTEFWLIDMYHAHPNLAPYTVRTLTEARKMLASLNTFTPNDRGQELCITIEDASVVLQDATMRANLEDIMRALPIKFRFTVVSLDLFGFGGSMVIRDEALSGNVVQAVTR